MEKNLPAVKDAIDRYHRVTGSPAWVVLLTFRGEWETVAHGANAADAAKARGFLTAAGASVDVREISW